METWLAVMSGLTPRRAGDVWHGASRGSSLTGRAMGVALKVTPSNKRMHATRDTSDVINRNLAGGRVMRGVSRLPLARSRGQNSNRFSDDRFQHAVYKRRRVI
jgi:hypothetical protein